MTDLFITGMTNAMKRYQEKIKQRDLTQSGIDKVQTMLDALESTQITGTALGAVSEVTAQLNQNKMSEDEATDIMEKASEAVQDTEDVSNVLAQDLGNGDEITAEDQAAWFAEMEPTLPGMQQPAATVFTGSGGQTGVNGAVNPNFANAANLPMAPLPNAPTNAVQMSNEDREMAELAAQMGL